MMEHGGHRQRMRERFMREKLRSFAPHEALEMLLYYAIPRQDTNPIAHRLIDHFGSFQAVLEADTKELSEVDGVGEQAAVLISMLLPLLRIYLTEKMLPRQAIRDYGQIDQYCGALFTGATQEQCYVLAFDSKLRLKGCEMLSEGTVASVEMNPRRLVSVLLKYGASGAVVTHNHLSDNASPSMEDVDMTHLLTDLLEKVQIRLYDHIIVAAKELYSFSRDKTIRFDTLLKAALPGDKEKRIGEKK